MDSTQVQPMSQQETAASPDSAAVQTGFNSGGAEAYANRFLTDLGLDVLDTFMFRFSLQNWPKLDRRLVSDTFSCGGTEWRVLLFPAGNGSGSGDMVSLYLEHVAPESEKGKHVCAQFALIMCNPNDESILIANNAQHRFVPEESDWGFTRFSELGKLFRPSDGQTRPLIENEAVDVIAYVKVLKDPTGVLWHNFNNYDSKKETGYVGLKNQGATCYMNSLLQSLFFTPLFRKAVFQIPTEDELPADSVPLALQRVFYHLQTSLNSVGTLELTKAFGWYDQEQFLQHDVQELDRILQDRLETKMKNTEAEGAITRLFKGEMKFSIKCMNVDYESAKVDPFYDISLNVKGNKTLADSFKDYIQQEDMIGENKYSAEGHGLQDAKRGTVFVTFPPVLHLQLKRFEYDLERGDMIKINDRLEFPFEIDLTPYQDPNSLDDTPSIYHLHGVLVHGGETQAGHYFALIKPEKDGPWFKFDDDRVTKATDKEVLEDNFGGEYINKSRPVAGRPQPTPVERKTNAYMLVYVRQSERDHVLAPLKDEDTPAHLRRRLEEEKAAAEAKKRDRDEQHLYFPVKLVTDELFCNYEGFDLAHFENRDTPASDTINLKVRKDETYASFKASIGKTCELSDDQFRIWAMVNRQNKTTRADVPILESDPALTMEKIRADMNPKSDLKLYLEIYENDIPAKFSNIVFPHSTEQTILLFLKYFHVGHQTLKGVGKMNVLRTAKISQLAPYVCEKMGWPASTPVRLYEEIKPGYVEPMVKLNQSLEASELQDGDIICCQVELTEAENLTLSTMNLHTDPIHYYERLQNRLLVKFKPKTPTDDKSSEFELILSRKDTYQEMAMQVAKKIGHDELKLRFTLNTPSHAAQKSQPFKRTANQTVAEMVNAGPLYPIPSAPSPSAFPTLLYERLDVSLIELETKKSLKVIWTGSQNKEESTHRFLLPKTCNIAELTESLSKLVKLSENGSGKISVFEIPEHGKTQKTYTNAELIGNIPDNVDVYAEELPLDETNILESEKLINVFHYQKEASKWHGVPFRFVTRPGEPFLETKKRLQLRVGASDKDFGKYRFFLFGHPSKHPIQLEDNDLIYDHRFMPGDVLGLEHLDKTGKSIRGIVEKALTMR